MGKKSKSRKKRSSKKNKKKHRSESSTDHSSSSSEGEWIEKPPLTTNKEAARSVRDSWMEEPFEISTISKHKEKKEKKPAENVENSLKAIGQSDRELNPYWKDGGAGLPKEDKEGKNQPKLYSTSVGDQGLNWLYKSLKRSEQQAKEEKRSLEDVVAERWGSLSNLKKLISEAEDRNRNNSNSYERSDFRSRSPFKSERGSNKFLKPLEDDDNKSSHSHSKNQRYRTKGWKKQEDINFEKQKNKSHRIVHNSNLEDDSFKKVNLNESHESEEQQQKCDILSDKELNSLAARLLKAEILGDEDLVKELSKKLERAKNMRKHSTSKSGDDNIVILTKTNPQGFTQPVKEDTASKRKNDRFETYKDGKRIRYFEDDEKYSLKEMFENEKMVSVHDQNAEFCRLTSKSKKEKDDDTDDLFMDQILDKSKMKSNASDAVKEHKIREKMLDGCRQCLDSKNLAKHLVIFTGSKSYVSVPSYQSLVDGHCLIVPMYHSTCGTLVDEDVWQDIKDSCKRLVQMFKSRDHDVVFFEIAMHFNRRPHMILNCVPIPVNTGHLAPVYFKKAILECEKEWSMNKKLVEVNNMDIKRFIPKGLPYFMVSFGTDFGYAHVIENEKEFPRNFAQEIIGGMLDIDHLIWRKPHNDDFETQCKKVSQLKEWWTSYN